MTGNRVYEMLYARLTHSPADWSGKRSVVENLVRPLNNLVRPVTAGIRIGAWVLTDGY